MRCKDGWQICSPLDYREQYPALTLEGSQLVDPHEGQKSHIFLFNLIGGTATCRSSGCRSSSKAIRDSCTISHWRENRCSSIPRSAPHTRSGTVVLSAVPGNNDWTRSITVASGPYPNRHGCPSLGQGRMPKATALSHSLGAQVTASQLSDADALTALKRHRTQRPPT